MPDQDEREQRKDERAENKAEREEQRAGDKAAREAERARRKQERADAGLPDEGEEGGEDEVDDSPPEPTQLPA
jgi:hypothetical protein